MNSLPVSLLILTAAFSVSVWPTLISLNQRWANPEEPYESSYLILLALSFLIWNRVKNLDLAHTRAELWVVPVLTFPLTIAWFAGHVSNTLFLAQILLPLMYASWIWSAFGRAILFAIAPALMLIYLTIPVWGVLGVPLRLMAVEATSIGLNLLDLPAYIDGYQIHLPKGTVEVAGGCSGQNYLISGLALGGFAGIYFRNGSKRLQLVAAALCLSIVANWVRIFLLVLVAYYLGQDHPLLYEHSTFGIIVFFAVISPIFLSLRSKGRSTGNSTPPFAERFCARRYMGAGLGLLFVAAIPLAWITSLDACRSPSTLAMRSISESRYIYGSVLEQALHREKKRWGVSVEGREIVVQADAYTCERQGNELVDRRRPVLPKDQSGVTHTLPGGGSIVRFESNGNRIYAAYRVGRFTTVSPVWAKLYSAVERIHGRSGAAMINVILDKPANEDGISAEFQAVADVLGSLSWTTPEFSKTKVNSPQ